MKIQTKTLQNILSILKDAVAKESFETTLANYAFTGDSIVAFNDEIGIIYPFKSDFKLAIDKTSFYNLINRIKKCDEIELYEANKKLCIDYENNHIEMVPFIDSTTSAAINSALPSEELEWFDLPEDFSKALKLCSLSIGKDVSQYHLTCVCFKANQIVSSDDVRISRYSFDKDYFIPAFLLPGNAVRVMGKYEFKQYACLSSWLFLKNENDILYMVRLIDREYPDVATFFDFDSIVADRIVLPSSLKEMLDASAIFADGDNSCTKQIDILLCKDSIEIRANNAIGKILCKEYVDFPFLNEKIKIIINPFFLQEILKHSNSLRLGSDRALFSVGNFEHLIALFGE